jgi:hypothetical protein
LKNTRKEMIFSKIFKHLLIYSLLFYSYKAESQNVIVVDSITKLPLSFVAIEFNDTGFYSSIDGKFDLKSAVSDSIKIKLLGYKTQSLITVNVQDTIFLQPQSYKLDEIVLTGNPTETKSIKLLKGAKSFGSWPLQPKSEIITSVYPFDKIANYYVNKITIRFSKVIEKKELKNTNVKAYVRIHIYDSDKNKLSEPLYSSKSIDVNSFSKDIAIFDVSEQVLLLKESGIFIGLELIGYYLDSNEQESVNSVIRPQLTSKTNDYFKSNSYLRFVFQNNEQLIPMNEIIKKGNPDGRDISRNLNIGLELSK